MIPAISRLLSDGGPPPRPNLPHGTVLGVAPSGIIGYNCNYENFPELAEGEVFDQQTYVLFRFTLWEIVTLFVDTSKTPRAD